MWINSQLTGDEIPACKFYSSGYVSQFAICGAVFMTYNTTNYFPHSVRHQAHRREFDVSNTGQCKYVQFNQHRCWRGLTKPQASTSRMMQIVLAIEIDSSSCNIDGSTLWSWWRWLNKNMVSHLIPCHRTDRHSPKPSIDPKSRHSSIRPLGGSFLRYCFCFS